MITEKDRSVLIRYNDTITPKRIYKHKFDMVFESTTPNSTADFIMFKSYIAGFVSRALEGKSIKEFNKEILDQEMKDFFAKMAYESTTVEEKAEIEAYAILVNETVKILERTRGMCHT